jgi:hypothetical protein
LWKRNIFSSSGAQFPYQTPEVLLSYVSKDAAEGEEICLFLALPVTPVTWVLESQKWLPKHGEPAIFLTCRSGTGISQRVPNSSAEA